MDTVMEYTKQALTVCDLIFIQYDNKWKTVST